MSLHVLCTYTSHENHEKLLQWGKFMKAEKFFSFILPCCYSKLYLWKQSTKKTKEQWQCVFNSNKGNLRTKAFFYTSPWQMLLFYIICTKLSSSLFYVQSNNPFLVQMQLHLKLPCTEATPEMFLGDDAKAVLQHSHSRVWWEAESVEACMRWGQAIIRFRRLINVKPWRQTAETFNWKILHGGPKEEKNLPLLRRHFFNNLNSFGEMVQTQKVPI